MLGNSQVQQAHACTCNMHGCIRLTPKFNPCDYGGQMTSFAGALNHKGITGRKYFMVDTIASFIPHSSISITNALYFYYHNKSKTKSSNDVRSHDHRATNTPSSMTHTNTHSDEKFTAHHATFNA